MRLLMLATVVTVVFLLIYTSNSRTGKDVEDRPLNDFYHRTKDAMSKVGGSGSVKGQAIINAKTGKKAGHIPADKDGDGDIDEDDKVAGEQLQQRLHAVAQEAKEKANEKGGLKPDRPSKVIGIGSSAEGQKKGMGAGDAGDVKPAAAAAPAVKEPEKVKAKAVEAKDKSMEAPKPKVDTKESKEEHDAEVELNKILKQAPGKWPASPNLTPFYYIIITFFAYRLLFSFSSNHLLQDLLPTFQTRQGYLARKIPHHTKPLCRRARQTSSGIASPGLPAGEDGPPNGPQRHDQRH